MRRWAGAAMAAIALAATSCGVHAGAAAPSARPTTTIAATIAGTPSTSSTTTAAATTSAQATPTTRPPAGTPTAEQLEAILPTAEALGGGYRLVRPSLTDPTGPNDNEPLGTDECPVLSDMDTANPNEDDPRTGEISRTFETADWRQIDVDLTISPKIGSAAAIDAFVSAVDQCGPIEQTSPLGTGRTVYRAATLRSGPDVGFSLAMTYRWEGNGGPYLVQITSRTLLVDGIRIDVTAANGIDPESGEDTPPDRDLAASIATALAAKVRALH